MKSIKRWSVVWVLLIFGSFILAANPISAFGQPDVQTPEVEPELLQQIQSDGSTGYLIYFREKADLSAAYEMDWETRGQYVVEVLQATAQKSQADVIEYLDSQKADYQSFWVDNVIVVNTSGWGTLNALMSFPEIEALRARRMMGVIEPAIEENFTEAVLAVEPNINHVLAPNVWGLGFSGSGMVVANIDTGVRSSHNALVRQYRGTATGSHNYNWLGAAGGSATPVDDHGHGTHTMGTIVGEDLSQTNQIGMAPGAQWIACDGCEGSGCSDTALLTCAQWIAAPYPIGSPGSPNPAMRPHVVNNSWGDCGTSYDNWYQGSVDAWHAAGIYPVFSNGNASNCGYPSPPGLNTVGNPARYGNVTGVGSSGESNGLYATHSNWGPTDNLDTVNPVTGWANLKPQVIAPGVSIRSSTPGSDTEYQDGWSGTSMSAPHVTGLVALMWNAGSCLIGDYATTETIIEQTATPILYDDGGGARWPNYATGWGEINALAAVEQAQVVCGPNGTIQGVVSESSTSNPIVGASVIGASSVVIKTFDTTTNASGFYQAIAPAETYTVTASAYGYQATEIAGVSVTDGVTTTLNIQLDPAAMVIVTGVVSDATTGWPLYARITIDGYPGDPIWTDPVEGSYSISLPEDFTYNFLVEAFVSGYEPASRDIGPLSGNSTENFILDVNVTTCDAPGYSQTTLVQEGFEGTFPPSGWTTHNLDGGGTQWQVTTLRAHSGVQAAVHTYSTAGTQDGWLVSPPINLTGSALLNFWENINWNAWYVKHSLWVCSSGCGSPPTNYAEVVEYAAPAEDIWVHRFTDLSAYAGQTVNLAFRYEGYDADDWYIDDVVVTQNCAPQAGGLVVGNVYDQNLSLPLSGASVENQGGFTNTTADTPADPNVDDGFYTLFSPGGNQVFTATIAGNYGAADETVDVVTNDTVRQDFYIPAGWLDNDPESLSVTVGLGLSTTLPLALTNLGGLPVEFEMVEMPGSGPVQVLTPATAHKVERQGDSSRQVSSFDLPSVRTKPFADIIQDGGFENGPGSGYWTEYSSNFGTPLCDVGTCGTGTGTGPRSGSYWAWFGGIAAYEEGSVDQDVLIPAGTANLTFWLEQIICDSPDDYLQVLIDDVEVYLTTGSSPLCGVLGYSQVMIDVSGYADGGVHNIKFYSEIFATNGGGSNFFVDDVVLDFQLLTDVPWLSEDPITGTIPIASNQIIDVTFDASAVTEPGVYTAELRVLNDTPFGPLTIPVTMTVVSIVDIQINSDWNLLALPLQPQNTMTASALLDSLNAQSYAGNCSEVDQWINSAWESFNILFGGTNFQIVPGRGYFVYCSTSFNWVMQGEAFQSGVQLNLLSEWNLIGVPYPNTYTSPSLLSAIGADCSEIDRWFNSAWHSYNTLFGGDIFDILPQEGYFLYCSQGNVFNP